MNYRHSLKSNRVSTRNGTMGCHTPRGEVLVLYHFSLGCMRGAYIARMESSADASHGFHSMYNVGSHFMEWYVEVVYAWPCWT